MLFQCPVWAVKHIVPASELPLWEEMWEREPWGFYGLDKVMSKTTHYLSSIHSRTAQRKSYDDYMFKTREELLDLTQEELDAMDPDDQKAYAERLMQTHKRVLN